jgi:catechol 2,3-dioxygenase-like lactoylglutathione lyase family enzyme
MASTHQSMESGLDLADERESRIGYHVGICVTDINKARDFYCGVLGFEEAWRLDAMSGPLVDAHCGIPGSTVWVSQLVVPGGSRIEFHQYDPPGPNTDFQIHRQGLNHISWHVKDVDAEFARLKGAGVRIKREPIDQDIPDHPAGGYRVGFFYDPWGLILELYGPMRTTE